VQQLRQLGVLGDVEGDPPGLVAGQAVQHDLRQQVFVLIIPIAGRYLVLGVFSLGCLP
jgi:hypothetical protein